jgi:cobalt-precorrin-5B (C1)-methyltransferase
MFSETDCQKIDSNINPDLVQMVNGGIVDLGAGGIVAPMSESACIEIIRMDLRRLLAKGRNNVIFTIGNFAEDFAQNNLKLTSPNHIKCSNFVGDALDAAAELGFTHALIVGHIGKLVKLGLGMFNTHASHGDGRIETLAACALEAGAPLAVLKDVSHCVTTDAALNTMGAYLQPAMIILQKRIEAALERRCSKMLETGFIIFNKFIGEEGIPLALAQFVQSLLRKLEAQAPHAPSSRNGKIICQSANASTLMEILKE